MFLAAMMAGTAQATPLMSGITDLPLRGFTWRISRSVRKLMQAM